MLIIRMKLLKPTWYLVFAIIVLSTFVLPGDVSADDLAVRSLAINSSVASANTSHTISFSFPNANNVGSIKLEWCTSPLEIIVCTSPAGINAASATLASQSGETGFSILSQTGNEIIITRAPAVTGLQANSYRFNNVTNPSNIGQFYMKVSSYSSVDATGSSIDFGGLAGAITQSINITTEVPPILNFCVGVSIPSTCSTASGSLLDLGTFSTSATLYGTSQFVVGTNAAFGYVVNSNGNTLTSGNNIIPALTTQTASNTGVSQFGINLRNNSNPNVGSDPTGSGGSPSANYNTVNQFRFSNGATIASHNDVANNRKYTESYIVNIDDDQPVGIYNTTITYQVTATF
jgi:hypothetical protein